MWHIHCAGSGMTMNKKILWLLTIFLVGAVAIAEAQQPKRIPRIGFLSSTGDPNRVPDLLAELLQLKVDILVLGTLTGIRAARQATKTIPIVMVIAEDPVA